MLQEEIFAKNTELERAREDTQRLQEEIDLNWTKQDTSSK